MSAPLALARGEVRSWYVRLDLPPAAATGFYSTLSADERDRSARFRFDSDRRRFVVARGALRDLLGRYVGTDAGQIRFVYNAFGKPALSPEFGSRLRFNLSHSGDGALIALAVDADIGVDLEQIRPLPDQGEIAKCFFSAAEVAALSRLPSHRQARAFFKCWTKREAYVKARGKGLGDPVPALRWSRYVIEPAPGYVGSLVVEGPRRRFRLTTWPAPPVPAGAETADPRAGNRTRD